MTEDPHATEAGLQSSHGLEEHQGTVGLDDQGGKAAGPPTERSDSAGHGPEVEAASVGVILKAPVIRMVPKGTTVASVDRDAETVVAFLRDLLGRLERGEEDVSEGLVVHYLSAVGKGPDGGCVHRYWRHGLSQIQHLGLLQVATHDLITEE